MFLKLSENNVKQIIAAISYFIDTFTDYEGEIMLFPYKGGIDVCRLSSRGASTIAYIPYGAKLEINEREWTRMQATKQLDNPLFHFTFTCDDVKLTFDLMSITLSSTKYTERQPGYFSIPLIFL